MPKWRPEWWELRKNEDCKHCVHFGQGKRDCVLCDRSYEAGADALLAALRQRGFHVDRDASFSSLGEHCILSNKKNIGDYVFIPDDQVNDGLPNT